MHKQLVVIGAGSAGLSAAIEARKQGIEDILVIERDDSTGGILKQCIHNGFGVHKYKEDLTGVEFAARISGEAREAGIETLTHTFVIDLSGDRVITAVHPEKGLLRIEADAVVLAMGCRERTRGALMIPGSRPAGVITAGTAQKYLNLKGYLPGKRVVILGSGDIGLIMARQFVMEGVEVRHVVELMPYSGGLARNIKQCLEDFDIPLSFNSTVTQIHGHGRISAVTVARVDENRRPVPGTEQVIECDTLMLSAGLIPENELTRGAGIAISDTTKGAEVDDTLMTSVEGVFSCGNVLHVHDLVDFVSEEGTRAGAYAARYLKGDKASGKRIRVRDGAGVNGAVPQIIRTEGDEEVGFMFRPRDKYADARIVVAADGKTVATFQRRVLAPGEMASFRIKRALLKDAEEEITVRVETGQPDGGREAS